MSASWLPFHELVLLLQSKCSLRKAIWRAGSWMTPQRHATNNSATWKS